MTKSSSPGRSAPAPMPHGEPVPVLLIIADISGYTRYMTANAKTLAHSQTIITELVTTIVREVELPLEVAKLEGDAVFLYCRKPQDPHAWKSVRDPVRDRLLDFFRVFREKIQELAASSTCTCRACVSIDQLGLKIIVHSGEAVFHHVFQFFELAGVDVIIVHRLLKNSVKAAQYLLLTETAARDLDCSERPELHRTVENFADIGEISIVAYLPPESVTLREAQAVSADTLSAPPVEPVSFSARYRASWRLYRRLWFAPLAQACQPPVDFRHLADSTTLMRRTALAGFTLLLTPFFLPVGALTVLVHELNRGKLAPTSLACNHHGHCACGK